MKLIYKLQLTFIGLLKQLLAVLFCNRIFVMYCYGIIILFLSVAIISHLCGSTEQTQTLIIIYSQTLSDLLVLACW